MAPAAPVVPTRQPAPVSTQPQDLQDQNPDDGGWVSNLLRRASEDEDDTSVVAPVATPQNAPAQTGGGRSPQHVVESLNSLSMDIARVIDHEASVELWERYRQGERDVFTRRLYALQNPQTMTEIRARFTRDEEFRNTVSRYMQEFENLLASIAMNDPDKSISRSYLATDIGKVYSMLSTAAGQLQQ